MTPSEQAYKLIEDALYAVKALPRFRGQTQIVTAMKRVLNLSVWKVN